MFFYSRIYLVYFHRSGYARDNGLRYVLRDHLGSTSVIVDAAGAKLWEDRYYPFGDIRHTWKKTNDLPLQTAYRFTGQRHETSIGLYDYRSRWYDPVLGRFVQADTIVPEPGNPQSLKPVQLYPQQSGPVYGPERALLPGWG